jgi:hypothetical protein
MFCTVTKRSKAIELSVTESIDIFHRLLLIIGDIYCPDIHCNLSMIGKKCLLFF